MKYLKKFEDLGFDLDTHPGQKIIIDRENGKQIKAFLDERLCDVADNEGHPDKLWIGYDDIQSSHAHYAWPNQNSVALSYDRRSHGGRTLDIDIEFVRELGVMGLNKEDIRNILGWYLEDKYGLVVDNFWFSKTPYLAVPRLYVLDKWLDQNLKRFIENK